MLRIVPSSSSLPLAKALYFNFYYSIFHVTIVLIQMIYKVGWMKLTVESRSVLPALSIGFAILEFMRLYVGRRANAKENVRGGEGGGSEAK